jgi:putative endonuclease
VVATATGGACRRNPPLTGPRPGSAGAAAEDHGLAWLEAQGLSLVERNFRCRVGEIDLVMREGPVTVFVEVRFRARGNHGSAAETVSPTKQRRLSAAARHYLQRHPDAARRPCRFDVLAITGERIDWIENAFDAS